VATPARAADYVGLGDSYSSGTGTASSYSGNCERTNLAYPVLIDAQLPGSGVNLSCSGARTYNITTDAQSPENPQPQLQLTGLGPDTDYVTLQIGGNDAGFVDTVIACGNPFSDCDAAVDQAEQQGATELPPKLAATYDAVRAKAPNATIVVVGYPRLFRPGQSCNTFFSANDITRLNEAADLLDSLVRTAARDKGFAYVSAVQKFIGHGACDSDEWINGLGTSNSFGNSYHPKPVGHQNGYFPIVLAGIQGVPDTPIDSKPAALSNTANPSFGFHSTVANSTFQCQLDGGGYSPCTSPRQYTGLSQGSHTFNVRATNANGDVDQFPSTHTWTIDTVAPSAVIGSGPTAGSTVSSSSANFGFSSNDGTATLLCKRDAQAFQSCTTSTSQAYSSLADGPHTFTLQATDPAGNVTTASRTWNIDTTAPVTTINSGPADPTPETTAELSFNVDDTEATTECRLDSADEEDWAPCTSPVSYGDPTPLVDGEHTFEVRGKDAVNNTGTAATYTWRVDSTAPGVNIDSGPDALTNETTADFTFTKDLDTVATCDLDGAGFVPCPTGTASYPAPLGAPLADGPHTFTVKVTDVAQNVATDTYSWVVDATPPDTAIESGPATPTNTISAHFTFTSPDNTATFECRLDSNQPNAFSPCTSPQNLTVAPGQHTFSVRAVDPAGNVDLTHASQTWSVDTAKPIASITGTPSATTKATTATFTFNATEPSTFECRLDSTQALDFEPCASGKSYAGLGDGTHTFDLRPTDAAGNVGDVLSSSWTIDATAPTATITGELPGSLPQLPPSSSLNSRTFTFSSSEAGSTFQCRLDSNQEAAFHSCASPRTETGITDGDHTFQVRAVDAVNNVGPATAYSWSRDTTTPVVSIDSKPGSQTNQNQAAFSFSVANEPEAILQCKLDNQAFDICATPTMQTYAGLADGSHTFTVKATDGAGHTSNPETWTWQVDTMPPVVNIQTGPAPLTRLPVATFNFTVVNGDPAMCKLDAGDFEACTTPKSYSNLGDGPHTFTVRSSDAANNTASDSRTWTVDTDPPETTIDGRPPSPTSDTTANFTFLSDEGGATFQCSLDGALYAACTSPQSVTGLALGDHNFRVRSTDLAGNLDATPATYVWRIQEPAGGVQGAVKPKPRCKKGKKKHCKKGKKHR
jgi:lysophospholipase L1-like esterase